MVQSNSSPDTVSPAHRLSPTHSFLHHLAAAAAAAAGEDSMASKIRLLSSRPSLLRSHPVHLLHPRPRSTTDPHDPDAAASEAAARIEAHRKLPDLNFTTAAEILSTYPRKKFGFDFHLVQFFFACMPSLAVYLVAQYSRYEMRKMNEELELKKKAEEEEKAKAAELEPVEEGPESDLLKVIVRLDVLEESVKEIVKERKNATLPNPLDGQEVVKTEKAEPTEDVKVISKGPSSSGTNSASVSSS